MGIPAIYVTHDQAEAMVMSKRIIVMDSGSVAQSGSPEEIYEQPESRFVAEFIGLSNFVEARVLGPGSDGRWLVDSAFGQHDAVGDHPETGQSVFLDVRPEHLN